MKILHTSDLHLGKCLMEESFYEDQKYILGEIINIVKFEKIDIVLIAGDIYDKNIPSIDAVNLFNFFLNELSSINTEVIIISGNHDSNDRLSFGSCLFNKLNIHIDTVYNGRMKKYSYDNVDIYTLPFIKPFHIKSFMCEEEYEKINNVNEMMRWVLNQEVFDKTKKNILVAHQFFMNGGALPELSDSESTVNVGTLDAIDVNLLSDFDYVALGHIHKPQQVKNENIRYSGTPLKYSFSEVNNKNSVVIYDSDTDKIDLKLLNALRNMRVLRGTFEEIISMEYSEDLVKVELEDENVIISPMEEIKKVFPNALSLEFFNRNKSNIQDRFVTNIDEDKSLFSLFSEFFYKQNGFDLSNEQNIYVEDLISNLEGNGEYEN